MCPNTRSLNSRSCIIQRISYRLSVKCLPEEGLWGKCLSWVNFNLQSAWTFWKFRFRDSLQSSPPLDPSISFHHISHQPILLNKVHNLYPWLHWTHLIQIISLIGSVMLCSKIQYSKYAYVQWKWTIKDKHELCQGWMDEGMPEFWYKYDSLGKGLWSAWMGKLQCSEMV